MHKTIISNLMKELDLFYAQLDALAPISDPLKSEERKKFSTFYVVCVAATYENCIRNILYDYSDFYHAKFSFQVEKKYERLNSRIKYSDLRTIISSFDGNTKWFDEKCLKIGKELSVDLKKAYDQVLDWRHSAAHANKYPTSLEEIYKFHNFVKYVIYSFEEAMLGYVRHQIISEASTKIHVAKTISNRVLEICSSEEREYEKIRCETEILLIEIKNFKHERRRAVICPDKSVLLLSRCSEIVELAKVKINALKKVT
ncbi:HEPN domain-containing protein [Morganella morganii]|uniref:HEPN domain-containing protein n=1 Tax=bacterium 19GA11TI05 TaxID=2920688 RepID=A0AAU6TT74_UNCXX